MGFIESYKHLEKLCGDVMNNDRRISAYIDEMISTPDGPYFVEGWCSDLKQLKHYRWVRNQITHEPGCTEQNMCEPGDTEWLDGFYSRIIKQTDPLALYAKTAAFKPVKNGTQAPKSKPAIYSSPRQTACHERTSGRTIGFLALLLLIFAVIFIVIILFRP